MPTVLFRIACLLLVIALPTAALAQPQTSVSLGDPDPPSWDASGHMSWLTVNKGDIAPEWNRWYDVATAGASVGYFLGPHLKLEFDVATSASAEVYVERRVDVPEQRSTFYFAQPHRFRQTTLAAGASYQFLDNRWIHPVIGGGLEAARETETVERVVYPLPLPGSVVVEPPGSSSTWRHRPYADVGFKWFVAERAFIRSDVRTTFDSRGVGQVSWRTGVGFDF